MCLLPGLSFGENPRIAELTRSKQEKMERLQKCEGTTKALKIAGLSTIGLTAVGVVGNVVESQKIKEYQGQSNALDTQIAQTKKEIEDKKAAAAVDKEKKGTSARSYNKNGSCYSYSNGDSKPIYNVEKCLGLEKEQWEVQFSYGLVGGNSKCSSTSGTKAVAGEPASSDGKYCWCKAMYYTPSGGQRQDVASSSWVFNDYGSASDCAKYCANYCVINVQYDPDFRAAVFAGAQ